MKKSFLGSVALFASLATAHAADMPVKAPLAPPPPYNWSGFYIGANLGGAWTNGSLNILGNNLYGGLRGSSGPYRSVAVLAEYSKWATSR